MGGFYKMRIARGSLRGCTPALLASITCRQGIMVKRKIAISIGQGASSCVFLFYRAQWGDSDLRLLLFFETKLQPDSRTAVR